MGRLGFDEVDIPGITSYYTEPAYDFFSATNVFLLFFVLLMGGIFVKMKNKKNNTDDEYVKTTSGNGKGIVDYLKNPFNRKNDKDDDFDKVL